MKKIGVVVSSCLLATVLAGAQESKPATGTGTPAAAPPAHTLLAPADVQFGPGPAALPKGAELAVLSGDPSKAGPFTIRARFPAGYKVPPHWHPTDEHVTVLSGTVSFGMGDTFDTKTMKELSAGGFAAMPATMRHYVWSREGATIQVHGTGPFAVTYVDPKDDPRPPKPATP
jgi:quercetin dioxygenase-like cupin family protein